MKEADPNKGKLIVTDGVFSMGGAILLNYLKLFDLQKHMVQEL